MQESDLIFLLILAVIGVVVYLVKQGQSTENPGKRKPHQIPEFARFPDKYETLEDVAEALQQAGLESSNLIVGIDYTASNESTGRRTFDGKCLHHLDKVMPNPYQQVIAILGRTLAKFDEDNLIPVYGFGDVMTKAHSVFPFYSDRSCCGFEDVIQRYEEVTPDRRLSGPTSFAPLIREAIEIVKKSGNDFHILIIIGDGQVTDPKATGDAIREASHYPLAIVQVGVGDGPWDQMEEFDDNLTGRKFDNFQFVDFASVMRSSRFPDAGFALRALMEVPQQFQAVKKLGLLCKGF